MRSEIGLVGAVIAALVLVGRAAQEGMIGPTNSELTEPRLPAVPSASVTASVFFANKRGYSLAQLREEAVRVLKDPYGYAIDDTYRSCVYLSMAGRDPECAILFTSTNDGCFHLVELGADFGVNCVTSGGKGDLVSQPVLIRDTDGRPEVVLCMFRSRGGIKPDSSTNVIGRALMRDCASVPGQQRPEREFTPLNEVRLSCVKAISALGCEIDERWHCAFNFDLRKGECSVVLSGRTPWYEVDLDPAGTICCVRGMHTPRRGAWWEQKYQDGEPVGNRKAHEPPRSNGTIPSGH